MRGYYDSDADLSRLRGRKIAVIGYGSQGRAQANNLRDSGCEVVVGLSRNSLSRRKASDDGFAVLDTAEAALAGEIVMMLVPDELAPEIYQRDIQPGLAAGDYLGFSHGFSIHFRKIVPPPDVNVFMVAPKAPGHLERLEYTRGRGVPCLFAVHQDVSGDTRQVALAYASAIGGGRAGILETTFKEETETDLFGEQAVLCGGLSALVQAGFDTLVEAGYAPEMAYFECLHELKLIVDLIYEGGISNMRSGVSNTARYGDMTRGLVLIDESVRERMRLLLRDVQSGKFADEWMTEHQAGKPRFKALEARGLNHPSESVGKRLRQMMSWLAEPQLAGRT